MFDFVANHVSDDCPLITDHPHRFKPANQPPFGDCAAFDYDRSGDEIIEQLWKPYLTRFIKTYGFMGVRIDAAKFIPSHILKYLCELIYDLATEKYERPPIIMAEIAGK